MKSPTQGLNGPVEAMIEPKPCPFPPPWSVGLTSATTAPIWAEIASGPYHVPNGRGAPDRGDELCGAASAAGASVGYPIRISLTVGLAARICGFEEAYSLFGDNAPIIFADTFGSARRLSPALQPPAKLASSPPPQSLPAATPFLSKPFSLKLLWFSFSSSASVSPRRSPPGAVQSDWPVMTIR